jgi:translation initiation factor IF-3|tara:strand:+ start:1369 stop:1881 length:513 start_codon:yes stop_codon:yes gene_type:complete
VAKSKRLRANDQITSQDIRLIDHEAKQHGIVPLEQGLKLAKSSGLDLVEVSPNGTPPVCKIMDYGKLIYQKKKHIGNSKKTKVSLKEIKFRPNTDVGDFNIKLRKIRSFIEAGHRVKVSVVFRGREMQHKDLGAKILERVENDLREEIDVSQTAQQEGRQMFMLISPRKT